jgi:hypothetical protein
LQKQRLEAVVSELRSREMSVFAEDVHSFSQAEPDRSNLLFQLPEYAMPVNDPVTFVRWVVVQALWFKTREAVLACYAAGSSEGIEIPDRESYLGAFEKAWSNLGPARPVPMLDAEARALTT